MSLDSLRSTVLSREKHQQTSKVVKQTILQATNNKELKDKKTDRRDERMKRVFENLEAIMMH